MNDPGDLTVTHSSATPDPKNCSLVSILPIVGMSSCRGRAEAFARRLSSKLRTLGTQADDTDVLQEDEPIINGGNTNTWVTGGNGGEQTVTDLQPLRHETDSFFDFDCELESPGSPIDECEYLRLIESTLNTPHNSAAESGYACASAASSHSSSDGPYFDVNSENEACISHLQQPLQQHHQQTTLNPVGQPHGTTVYDEVDNKSMNLVTGQSNGYQNYKDLKQTLPSEEPDTELAQSVQKQILKELYKQSLEQKNEEQIEQQTRTEISKEAKQIEISQSVQENVLKELHKQSLEHKDEEKDNKEIQTRTEILKDSKLNVQENVLKELYKEPLEYSVKEDSKKMNLAEGEIATKTLTEHNIVHETDQGKVKQDTKQIIRIINGHVEYCEDVLKIEEKEIPREELKAAEIQAEKDTNANDLLIAKSSSKDDSCTTEHEKQNKTHLHMETTDDEDDCRPQRVRRCSSLKTGKTPPGTPGRKKIVRFADVLGLDLADVKTFLDEIPNIPKSAYEDLEISESETTLQLGPKANKLLMPLFQQPGGLPNYLDIVREKLVSLENAAVTDAINQTITGSVRVRNLDFHKSVHLRYSLDGWRSFADLQANYVENSCDGFSDKFTFVLFGNSLHIGQRLEFAVRFQCKGQQYWDNNYGANYCFQCLPAAAPLINPISAMLPSHHNNNMLALLSPTVGETWCTSFY